MAGEPTCEYKADTGNMPFVSSYENIDKLMDIVLHVS